MWILRWRLAFCDKTPENWSISGRRSKIEGSREASRRASHRFLGIVCPAMLSMGAEIDQRTWATDRAWRELCGIWWNKRVLHKIKKDTLPWRCVRSLPHGPHCISSPRSRLPSIAEVVGKKAPRAHARNGLMGRTRPHKDPQLSPRLAPLAFEFCVQRLRVYQSIAREPARVMHIIFVVGLADSLTAFACILRQMVMRSDYWQTYRRWLLFLSGLSRLQ